jgi:hypothetical protein
MSQLEVELEQLMDFYLSIANCRVYSLYLPSHTNCEKKNITA